MTPEEQYITQNKPERFFRVQMEIPSAAVFDIFSISVEICHGGRYTGSINSDGSFNLDATDAPLGTVIPMGSLSEISSKSKDPENFNLACQAIFDEINRQATIMIENARLKYQ